MTPALKKSILSLIILILFMSPIVGPLTARAQTNNPIADQSGSAIQPPSTTGFYDQLSCSITSGAGFGQCILVAAYFFGYTIPAGLLYLSAHFFNAMAGLTLSSSIYTQSSFIGTGWRITRDIANIFFIIILLYIALALVLDIEVGHASPKKMLVSLILIALLINFSMFITEVVIDASNVLALLFYNQISVVTQNANGTAATYTPVLAPQSATDVTEIDLAGGMAKAFKPQLLSDPNLLAKFTNYSDSGWVGSWYDVPANIANQLDPTSSFDVPTGLLLIAVCAAIFLAAAYAFFVSAISFLGRLVGLWVSIIFAPFAFITYIIPSARTIPDLGWKDWWSKLLKMAFAAPIFMFFIYLITLLCQSTWISKEFDTTQSSTLRIVLLIVIPTAVIITLLIQATKYAKEASGVIGEAVFGVAKFLGGAALGLATGGIAIAGAKYLGGAAKNRITDEKMDMAAGEVQQRHRDRWSDKTAEQIKAMPAFKREQRRAALDVKYSRKVASGSFDVRQTAIGGALGSAAGINMESFWALSTKKTVGGYQGKLDRDYAKEKSFSESLGVNHRRKVALEDTAIKREEDIKKETGTSENLKAEMDTQTGITKTQTNVAMDPRSTVAERDAANDAIATASKKRDELQEKYNESRERLRVLNIGGDTTRVDEKDVRSEGDINERTTNINTTEEAIKKAQDDKVNAEKEIARAEKVIADPKASDGDKTLAQERANNGYTQLGTIDATLEALNRKMADAKSNDSKLTMVTDVKRDDAGNVVYKKDKDGKATTEAETEQREATKEDIGKLRDRRNGWQDDEVGNAIKANGEVVTASDVGKARTDMMGLGDIKELMQNEDKARAKAYIASKMAETGYEVHGTKYDQLGNVVRVGHMDTSKERTKDMSRAVQKGLKAGIAGALVGSLAGPVGAAILGGFSMMKPIFEEQFKGRNRAYGRTDEARVSELLADEHTRVETHESSYKAPTSKLFDFLKEVSKDKGHGGGGGDHGHGSKAHAGEH